MKMQIVWLSLWAHATLVAEVIAREYSLTLKGELSADLLFNLFWFDQTKNLLLNQCKQSVWIQANKIGRQPYSDTSPLCSKWVFSVVDSDR